MPFSIAVLVLTAVLYPPVPFDAAPGNDRSWAAALQLAERDGLHFGDDFSYTYGPLGWLTSGQMLEARLALLAHLLRAVTVVAMLGAVLFVLKRRFGLVGAAALIFPVAWVFTNPTDAFAAVLYLSFMASVLVLAGEIHLRQWQWAVVAMVSGVWPHTKIDNGWLVMFTMLATAGAEALVRDEPTDATDGGGAASSSGPVETGQGTNKRRMRAARQIGFVGVFSVGGYLCSWLATGQSLTDLPRWWQSTVANTLGFPAVLGQEGPRWQFPVLLMAVLGVGLVVRERVRSLPKGRALSICSIVFVALLLIAKQAFTRHDSGHAVRLAIACSAFALVLARRDQRVLSGFVVVCCVASTFSIIDAPLTPFFRANASRKMLRDTWILMTDAKTRTRVVKENRLALQRGYGISEPVLNRIHSGTVLVGPNEIGVLAAYPELRWVPLPSLQQFNVVAPFFDDANAARIAGTDGHRPADVILWERGSIDDRYDRFDGPSSILALLCHYDPAENDSRWQAFVRRPQTRCAPPQPLGTNSGTEHLIPTADTNAIVVAHFGLEPSTFSDIVTAVVLRPTPRYVRLGDDPTWHRFPTPTANDAHVLVVPQCLAAGLHAIDPTSFARISFARDGGSPVRSTATFESVAVQC